MYSKQEEWSERYKSKHRWRKSERKTRRVDREVETTSTKYGNFSKHRRLEPIYGNEIKKWRERKKPNKNIRNRICGWESNERRKLHDIRSKSVSTWTSFWFNSVSVCVCVWYQWRKRWTFCRFHNGAAIVHFYIKSTFNWCQLQNCIKFILGIWWKRNTVFLFHSSSLRHCKFLLSTYPLMCRVVTSCAVNMCAPHSLANHGRMKQRRTTANNTNKLYHIMNYMCTAMNLLEKAEEEERKQQRNRAARNKRYYNSSISAWRFLLLLFFVYGCTTIDIIHICVVWLDSLKL